ncbi:MAG: SUMF1/EgtB/PvdO family nonheme iron enzyme [Lentisphaerae bacterium]|nr:SUMF1/EgtB/PvdO family nonheme iron enzyme [Lentisphaerota bacterium]
MRASSRSVRAIRRAAGGVLALLAVVVPAAGARAGEDAPALIEASATNGDVTVGLQWAAEGGMCYDVLAATTLAHVVWTPLVPPPLTPTNLIGELTLPSPAARGFYRVRLRDAQGPTLTARYPTVNGAGVGRATSLTVLVEDASGIDTNAYALAINGLPPLAVDAPGVIATTNRFAYAPAGQWGTYGETVTVTFACADRLGNVTTADWSFSLERLPVITNGVIDLRPPSGGQLARARDVVAAAAESRGVRFADNLAITAITSNQVVLSYTGAHGLYAGAILINHDPAACFYRRIQSISDDATNHVVTVATADVALTEFVQEGTLSPEALVLNATGAPQTLAGADLVYGIPFAYSGPLAIPPIAHPPALITWTQATCDVQGQIALSAEIGGGQVVTLEAASCASLRVDARTRFEAAGPVSEYTGSVSLGSYPLASVMGYMGSVPIQGDVELVLDVDYAIRSDGALDYTCDVSGVLTNHCRLQRGGDGWHAVAALTLDASPRTTPSTVTQAAALSACLRPRLTTTWRGLASLTHRYRLGPGLECAGGTNGQPLASFLIERAQADVAATVMGTSGGGWTNESAAVAERVLAVSHWPALSAVAPAITRQPTPVAARPGDRICLYAGAAGDPAPVLQWFQNGQAIPFADANELCLTMGAQALGSFHLTAANRYGRVTSQVARISFTPPDGMVPIPAGSFSMGDFFNDGASHERPVHTVFVSEYFVDRYEVSKALWDAVRAWRGGNGFSYDNSGAGKAANHPVMTLSWYDCVKWCNARSLREGLVPAYYSDADLTQVYRTGQVAPHVKWSANGYRLPTEAEWEKVARGGATGRRYAWSDADTIDFSRANYYSLWSSGAPDYAYDHGATRGYHPTYAVGNFPYTCPVNAFPPNGYGVHNVMGNASEWCWDWHSSTYYSTSPASDPQGPASGTGRVIRNSSYGGTAQNVRCAHRGSVAPQGVSSSYGFRCVRR